ncbi:MAG: hypothetical protein Q9159_003567 [Coniocarpon cinnabarinum]
MNNSNAPPPPPHGSGSQQGQQQQQGRNSNLPPGNYDIFVIPPHSSGSGFLYLPSLQPHRNSFLAGVLCTLVAVGFWTIVAPAVRQWASTALSGGGSGVMLLVVIIGVVGWAAGKTQAENTNGGPGPTGGAGQYAPGGNENTSGSSNTYSSAPPPPPPNSGPPPPNNNSSNPRPNWQQQQSQSQSHPKPPPQPSTDGWQKAREEMRKKEEERRKREEADKKAKEAAEKARWDQARAREREMREKEARERVAQERVKREKEAKEAREKAERAEKSKAAQEKQAPGGTSNYRKPTAESFVDSASYYQSARHAAKQASQSSFTSEGSYMSGTGSESTARTTPPPSHRGPYVNKDPDKVSIRGVYLFSDTLPGKPIAQLARGMGTVTDGLVLKMTTEGLFIDDDVRGVPQREWDVKAWTMKLVESGDLRNKHILRASTRDAENKKYVFIIDEAEAWKVAVGLQRLRKGSQVRSLGVSGLSANDMANIARVVGI